MQGQSSYPTHRWTRDKPLTFAIDLEDGDMIFIVVKNTGEVGLMAFDTNTEQTIDELHIVGKYDKHGDYEVESLGVMHVEADALIHKLLTGAELGIAGEEEDDDDLE